MTNLLLQIGVSKLIISLGLAVVAWAIQRSLGPELAVVEAPAGDLEVLPEPWPPSKPGRSRPKKDGRSWLDSGGDWTLQEPKNELETNQRETQTDRVNDLINRSLNRDDGS